MSVRIFVIRFAVVMAALAAAVSCGRTSTAEPSASDYSDYISAFTGGVVAPGTSLRIDLARPASAMPADGLFSMTPQLKGEVKWLNDSQVCFVPDSASVKPGQTYKVVFALSKVIDGAPAKFRYDVAVKAPAKVFRLAAAENGSRSFRVLRAFLKDESCIEVQFTEAPVNASEKGLVELQGASRSYVRMDGKTMYVHFEGRRSDLTLTLDKGVKDKDGSSLGEDYVRVFGETEEPPAVTIPFKGNILPDKQSLILPFKAVNLSAVEVRVVKIYASNMLMFLQDNDLGEDRYLRRNGRLVYKGDVPLDSSLDLHKWNTHSIDLSGLFRQEPGAVYRIRLSFRQDQSLYGLDKPVSTLLTPISAPSGRDAAEWDEPETYYWDNYYSSDDYNWRESDDPSKPSYYMDSSRFPSVQLLASDLGLMADYSGQDRLWVTVTDLISAGTVPGASVEAFDFQLQSLAKGKTDSKGFVTLKVARKPFALVAKAGGSVSYLKLTDGSERSMSRFDIEGEVLKEGLKAYIYGERGVWRPADTLHVTAIVSDRGKSLPDGHPATLEVYTPSGQFYSKLTRSGKDGFYSFDIPTRPDDPTGYWNAYLKVGGSSFHKVLHVETIKPNRLKINTSYPQILEAGVTSAVQVEASWLTGGVAGNLPVRSSLTLRQAGGAPFKGFEKYSFSIPSGNYGSKELTLFKSRLAADGRANVSLTMPPAENAPGMLRAFIVTSVEEPGGDESFTTETLPYSPYSSYVGIRVPEGDFLETDKNHSFSVAVLGPEGKRVKGHKVEYAVFQTGWNWWWDNGGGDLDAYVHGSSVEKVQGGYLTPGSSDASFTFKVDYPLWGRYLVLARDVVSGHVSGATFFVDWPDYRGRADRRDPESLTMLTFSTDKPAYRAGEKATVYIPAAEGGRALVTLSNASGIISREWVSTRGTDTPWTFTVTPEMAPNIYAHVTLLQPYGAVKNDLPIRLYGVRKIKVENPASHLEPVVNMPDVLHPEEPFVVKVSEKNGRPMTYTLAIVDEGLLDLTSFKTPDPWKHMYKDEAMTMGTWDLYDSVIGSFGAKLSPMASIGGDEDAIRNARKDNRFNPVVLCLPPRTVTKGTDQVRLSLPMYVGSVRVMVVCARDGAFGSTDKTVPVRNPLMVVTTLPRVMGCGEKTYAAVNVFAMEDGIGEATVSLKAEGPLSGGGVMTARFSGKGDRMLSFPLEASAVEGTARISVTATGNGHTASETISLEVRNPNPEVTRIDRFTLEKGGKRQVEASSLQLAGFPAVDVKELYLGMKNYPYNCAEQLSAKGMTYLYLLPLLDGDSASEARSLIPGVIGSLYSRQQQDGGFAYWPGGKSDTWVSSMAGQFLTAASKEGFNVDSGVLKRWKSYQQKMSQVYRLSSNNFLSNLDEAYRLYTMALSGNANLAGMNRMKEAAEIGSAARWMLASAYAVSGKVSLAEGIIDGTGREFPEYESSNMTYGTSERDLFLAIDALALCGRVEEALRLSGNLPTRGLSTQESAFAAAALNHLRSRTGDSGISAKVGGRDVLASSSLVQMPLDGPVAVENLSDGKLYCTAVTVSREPSRRAVSNGMDLDVSFFNEDGAPMNPASVFQGARFSAKIKVTGNAMRPLDNLALSFAIPSGWEIVNERMRASAPGGDSYDYKDIRDDRVNWFFSLPAGRSRTFTVQLRAAYEGRFVLPATVCGAMYDPSVSASTASGSVEVVR